MTYTDALGTHTKPYHAGMEVPALSPVTITCTNHHVHDWSIDADVQEATIVGVGGITYPGGTGIHVKGTNTIKAFATNFGLHYINIVVILGEGNDNGGDNGGGNNGGGNNGGGDNGNGTDPNNPDGNGPDGNNPDGNNPDGNNPDGNNPDGNNPDGSKSNTPKTGDTRLIWLVIALAVIFVATFAATYYNRRKSKHHGA